MARFSPTAQDLVNIEKRMHEISKRVGNGSLDPKGAYEALQPIVEGKFPLLSDPFGNYANLLLPLGVQLDKLHEYNKKYWDNDLTGDMFAAVDTISDHVQTVEDIEILFVQFGSDMETFEAWAKVIKGENPNFYRGESLNQGYDIRRLNSNTRQYPFGIYRVHINLAAHWEPKSGRTVDEVRAQAKTEGSGEQLAHGEILAAYGLHPELLQQTDGTNLPYADLAGYEVKPSGGSGWRCAPFLGWVAGYRGASLYSFRTASRRQHYAAPVVWEL